MKNDYPNLTQKMIDAIATVMDDEIREELHSKLSPCHPGEFLTAYIERDPTIEAVLCEYDTGKTSYEIELAFDCAGSDEGAREFADWLNSKGHDASVGSSTGSYVDGQWTSMSERAREIMNQLWDEFCGGQ